MVKVCLLCSPSPLISSLWPLSSFLIHCTDSTYIHWWLLPFFFLVRRLFIHGSKAVKCICSPLANRPHSSFQRGHFVCVSETRTGTLESVGLYTRRGMRSKLHTHLEPEHKASCWVNKENRQLMRVREHKQNSAKLQFAFHISQPHSIAVT